MTTTRTTTTRPYQVCVECDTEYPTAAALMAAHARATAVDEMAVPGPGWLRFCAACLHEFVFCPADGIDLTGNAAVISECLRRNGFDPEQAVARQVLNLAEEVGEFVGAYRRWTGQARRSGTAEDMWAELADVVITAFVTAHELEIDLHAVITAKLHTIHTRGWRETTPTTRPASRVRINLDGGAR
jgi:NTP pyrophosphatase (non-canonical NTP hydrolase)